MFLFNTAVLFFIGFFLLIKGADFLVHGATEIAKRLRVSEWVVGILILGIGTSIPEFAVMLTSALSGSVVGIGTIVGSNTFNILFILGIAAVVAPLTFERKWAFRDVPINLIAITATGVFLALPVFGIADGISRTEGLVLLLCGAVWMYLLVSEKRTAIEDALEGTPLYAKKTPLATLCFFIVAGAVAVIFGGLWVVEGAVVGAKLLGVSESLIGLSIIGIGSSLPEFVVTVGAARRGKAGLAAGNIIGSNIFNFLGILAFVATVAPVGYFEKGMVFDFMATALATLVFYFALLFGKGLRLSRAEGVMLVVLYILYLGIVFVRG